MKKTILILAAIVLFFAGCKKFDEIGPSKVVMNYTMERGRDYIKISGEYDYPVVLEAMTLYLSETEDMSGAKTYECIVEGKKFSVEANGLKDGTKYYYQYEYDNGYTKEKGLKGNAATIGKPIVITKDAGGITTMSAVLSGEVTNNDASNKIEERGFCWATEPNPTIEGEHYNNGGSTGTGTSTFSYNLTNLQNNTTYYFRVYIKTNYGIIYGEVKSFKTVEITLPMVTTNDIINIKANSATCGGYVTSDGNTTVTSRGVCWSTNPNPTIFYNKTSDGSGIGSFTSNLTNLTENTTYYVRAYATNEAGTSYGEVKSFKTLEKPVYQTISVNGVSFTMIAVEGGTFQMGATSEQGIDTYSFEKPVHSVTLSDYYIGETEVTQELWEAVMGSNPSSYTGDQNPVESVSWDDCKEFIEKLNNLTGKNFRLPTEAEWEYAARGGNKSQGYKYSGSNNVEDVAWCEDNSNNATHHVKTKSPNELGIYDMSGNVWEWCEDWLGNYSSELQINPTGPSSGSARVRRGGSWYHNAWYCRVSNRGSNYPDCRYDYLGLRLALSQ